jgi:hypothetical protein
MRMLHTCDHKAAPVTTKRLMLITALCDRQAHGQYFCSGSFDDSSQDDDICTPEASYSEEKETPSTRDIRVKKRRKNRTWKQNSCVNSRR